MIRTAVGVSLLVVLTLGGVAACGSDGDEATGKGGSTGTGGNGAGTGGTSNGAGTGGTSNGGRAGSASVAGGTGDCTSAENMCVDAQTLAACDPDTGMLVNIDCTDFPAGIEPLGCDVAASGNESCIIDFTDEDCLAGADILAFCADATEEQFYNAYFNCFNDAMGAREVITCFIPFADQETQVVDCDGAATACIEDVGAGGAGGASGGADAGAGGGG